MSFGDGSWNKDRSDTSQVQRRVAILGGIALIAFGVILFRLWYLQVLSGDRYLAEAQGNRVRAVTVQAPRGEILDRDGEVLVGNRTALALQVRKDELPENRAERVKVLERVAEVTGMSLEDVRKEIDEQTKALPSNPVTLQRDVPESVVFFVRENQAKFQGVSVDRVYVRQYPQGSTAAHLLGYVKEVSAEQLEEPAYTDLEPGDEIGLDGVELSYDSVLRGVNGETRVPVDSSGSPTGRPTSVREPTQGNDLVLSIDSDLQAAGEQAMAGRSGAFVALDVKTGEILAMGSSPTFDPSELAKPELSNAAFEQIFDPDNTLGTGAPAFNRSIAAGYPTGSTFKPITALAALDAGRLTPTEIINDDGLYKVGTQEFRNAGDASYGPIALRARSRSPRTSTSTRSAGVCRRTSTRTETSSSRTGRSRSAWATSPASTCPARPSAASPRPNGATSCSRTATPIAPGRWATTSTSPSARVTSWPLRFSSRSRTRRSATAGPW